MPNCAESTICNDQKSLSCTAGGLGGAVSSLAGPGHSAGGGGGGVKSLQALKNLHSTVPKRGQKTFVWCIFLLS